MRVEQHRAGKWKPVLMFEKGLDDLAARVRQCPVNDDDKPDGGRREGISSKPAGLSVQDALEITRQDGRAAALDEREGWRYGPRKAGDLNTQQRFTNPYQEVRRL